jgi:ribosomal protein S18 acetylase RimI-like enzyme
MILPLRRDLSSATRSVVIEQTTQQTYRQSARVLARAFVDDPVTTAVYPKFSSTRRIEALIVDFIAELKLCMRRGYPVEALDGDKVLGAAVIYAPGNYPIPAIDQWYLLLSSILGNGLYNIRDWLLWLNEVDKYHPTVPHYYLEYIGVDPEHQGKGVGSSILQHLIDHADEDHVGCYLENANPGNIIFYQRFGFQIMEEKQIIGLPTWLMWRSPV